MIDDYAHAARLQHAWEVARGYHDGWSSEQTDRLTEGFDAAVARVSAAAPALRAEFVEDEDYAAALHDAAVDALWLEAKDAASDLSTWRVEIEVNDDDIGTVEDVLTTAGLPVYVRPVVQVCGRAA